MRVILLMAMLSTAATAAVINNSSFEFPSCLDDAGYCTVAPTGWTTTEAGVDIVTNTLWIAADGTQSVDLNAFDTGGIYQEIATDIGALYTVSFSLAGNPYSTGGKIVRASVDNDSGTFADYWFNTDGKTAADPGWIQQEFRFLATSELTTLSFTSLTSGNGGPAIDNLAISSVPEPGTALLAGLAFTVLAVLRRHGRV